MSAPGSRWIVALALLGVVSGAAAPAAAQPDYFRAQASSSRPTYRVEGERTRSQRSVLAALAGSTVLAGGVGVLFTMRYQDAADDVEAFAGEPTNRVYSAAVDERRREAERASVFAGVAYGVGAGLLAATIITYIATEPEDEIRTYGSGVGGPISGAGRWMGPLVAPVDGGVVLGATWSY